MKFPFHPTPPPRLLLKNVKLFIYGAILLKFEAQHFHMFIYRYTVVYVGIPIIIQIRIDK